MSGKVSSGETAKSTFRLGDEVLERLDRIAASIASDSGRPCTRTDVIRLLAKEKCDKLDRKK